MKKRCTDFSEVLLIVKHLSSSYTILELKQNKDGGNSSEPVQWAEDSHSDDENITHMP